MRLLSFLFFFCKLPFRSEMRLSLVQIRKRRRFPCLLCYGRVVFRREGAGKGGERDWLGERRRSRPNFAAAAAAAEEEVKLPRVTPSIAPRFSFQRPLLGSFFRPGASTASRGGSRHRGRGPERGLEAGSRGVGHWKRAREAGEREKKKKSRLSCSTLKRD